MVSLGYVPLYYEQEEEMNAVVRGKYLHTHQLLKHAAKAFHSQECNQVVPSSSQCGNCGYGSSWVRADHILLPVREESRKLPRQCHYRLSQEFEHNTTERLSMGRSAV